MLYKEMLEELGFFSLKRGLRKDVIAIGRIESSLAEALGNKAQLQSSPAGLRLSGELANAHRSHTP